MESEHGRYYPEARPRNRPRKPGAVSDESAAYRQARNALLAEEAAKKARGWSRVRVFSDTDGDYTRDYVSREDADVPGYNVFTRRDGTIRHF